MSPLDYLHGNGVKAYPVVGLTWGLLGISVSVIVIISLLVLLAIFRRPGISNSLPGQRLEVAHPAAGLGWIWTGVGLTGVALLASIVWTVVVLYQVRTPRGAPLTIEVTGHQWWWEFKYDSDDPAQVFTTANEIHIPTGVSVLFKLKSADVIHSFWIPKLSGKMDAIPGLNNETWMEAEDPGVYAGQCTEYCGVEHAKMRMQVTAEPQADFDAWRKQQVQPPAPPVGEAVQGQALFMAHCAGCHAVDGTDAAGNFGPNLSHLMGRKTIAAGILPNDPANLLRWISDPQGIKPGSLMPKPAATDAELADIRAYLLTLH